nr:reverse transcriptase domain-containing protein [Tanacetum cinerariifolium]GEX55062.1 reverse transcriptase domain-containing protein [Tanacetum cinerariifolium]
MRTRSNFYPSNSTANIPKRSNRRRIPNIVEPEIRTIAEIISMADRTMEELLQAPTEGYGEAVVISENLAENFEIKTNLLQLDQANKFHGRENDNPHTHISNFKRMTATLKYRDVSNDAIKLMVLPYSLEDRARIWYEKEPPKSILTWDDLVNKFVNQFFPPSKTTHLKNEIFCFTQRFEETFSEAWDRFKELLRAFPHHGFLKLTQIDTFYNGLTKQDQDSLNAASGGNLLNKTTREALQIIKNKSKVRYSRSKSNVSRVNMNSRDVVSKTDDQIDKLADQISNLVEIVNKQVIAPAKAVEKTCVTCGGAHAYYECIATDSNPSSVCAATGSYNQVFLPNRASHQIPPHGFAPVQNIPNRFNQIPNNHIPPSVPNGFSSYIKSNEIAIKTMQNQINVLRDDFSKQEENLRRNLNDDMRNILSSFFQNQPSTLGTLTSNTIPNPKGEMKAVTTRSGLAYEGPSIPTESPLDKVDKQNTEETLDIEHPNSSGSTAQVQPSVMPISILEPDVPRTQSKPIIPYPSWLNDQKLREKATNQMEKFFQIFHDLPFYISFAHALLLMPKFASTIKSLLANKDKLSELAKVLLNENCSAMLFKKLPEKLGDPVNRVDVIDVACEDFVQDVLDFQYNPKSSSPTLVSDDLISKTDACKVPIVKSSSPTLTPFRETEESKEKSSVEEPPELELTELPSHLKYAFLEDSNKLPVIIAKNLKVDEREALINVLKSHKQAITWKISDIKRIDLRFYTHKILMEDDYKPVVQSQRRVNPKIHNVIKKEVIKLLDAGMIYPISDSPWVSPIHCVPKKGGMTIVANENNELIPMRLVTSWRVCIDYRKLNDATRKYHFLLPFMDQMLERLTGNEFYCFLDGTFQRCMMSIFHDMIEKMMEDFLKIARPMTHLLEKETSFVFSKECIEAFNTLKKKLTKAPILIVPDWNLPFELMCDANDYAIAFKILKACHEGPSRGYHGANLTAKKAIIRDRGTYFCNDQFTRVMIKYGVTHRLATAYHPQTNGQVEVSNRRLKRILKRTVGENRTSWSDKLDDALCAFRTAYKTLIGCTPYKLVSGKSCHLLIKLEHRAYWALKHVNFDLKTAGDHRKLQLNELSELRDQDYENSVIYKERTKKLHDSKIKNRIFNVSDLVLLFNSHLKIFSGKLKTCWSGPFTITRVFPYGTFELSQHIGPNFKVNGHHVKHYFCGDVPSNVSPDVRTFPMDN